MGTGSYPRKFYNKLLPKPTFREIILWILLYYQLFSYFAGTSATCKQFFLIMMFSIQMIRGIWELFCYHTKYVTVCLNVREITILNMTGQNFLVYCHLSLFQYPFVSIFIDDMAFCDPLTSISVSYGRRVTYNNLFRGVN